MIKPEDLQNLYKERKELMKNPNQNKLSILQNSFLINAQYGKFGKTEEPMPTVQILDKLNMYMSQNKITNPPSLEALALAAQAWCTAETKHIEMVPSLCIAFARILDEQKEQFNKPFGWETFENDRFI